MGRVSIEAAVVVADAMEVATQSSAAVVVDRADLRCFSAGSSAGAIDASLTIGAVVVDTAAVAEEVPMRQVVRNGVVTDLDLDERVGVGCGLMTDAYLVLCRPDPASDQGGEKAPSQGSQDPATGSRGGQRACQPIESISVHRVNLPRRVRAERLGHVVELGHLRGSL